MKPALNQHATLTANGTQNWTDASISSDQTLQLFFGTEALANNTTTTAAKIFLGATDLTNNIAYAMGTLDASAASTTISHTEGSSTACLMRTASGGSQTVKAAVSAVLSTGITINQTVSDGAAYLFNALSLAGSDHVSHLSSTAFLTTDTSKVVTHGDSVAPDLVIIFVSVGAASANDSSGIPQKSIIGFWDGTNSVGVGMKCSTQSSPTALSARINTDLGHQISNTDTDAATWSIGSVGATTFTLTRTATDSMAAFVTCISIRHTSGTWGAKCGVATLPTATGNAALVTGMPIQPQVLLTVATRLTSTVFAANSDTAGSLSFGIACNNAGTTQQMAVAMTEKSGVATTVAKCYTSNNQALLSLDNTGAVVNAATVNSWDSGGVTLNHSAVGASAFEVMYLAFGITTPAVVGNRPLGGLPRVQMHWR